jgi:hypothetical protein
MVDMDPRIEGEKKLESEISQCRKERKGGMLSNVRLEADSTWITQGVTSNYDKSLEASVLVEIVEKTVYWSLNSVCIATG